MFARQILAIECRLYVAEDACTSTACMQARSRRRSLNIFMSGSCCRYDVSKKYPQGKTLSTALNQVFDPELSSWLLAELAENRDKTIGPNKVSESCLCCTFKNVADNTWSFMTVLCHRHCLACPVACPHWLSSNNKGFNSANNLST